MIVAKVRKSGRYDAKKYAERISRDVSAKTGKKFAMRETPCYFFIETISNHRR